MCKECGCSDSAGKPEEKEEAEEDSEVSEEF